MPLESVQNLNDLIDYLESSKETTIWVPRKLIVSLLKEKADELLPALPQHLAVNRKKALELCLSIDTQTTTTT